MLSTSTSLTEYTSINIFNTILQWTYDYSAALMGLGPSGWLEGSTNQMTFSFDFIVDDYDHMIYLQEFKVTSYGDMNLKLRGNSLIDWFSNVIVSAVSTVE